MGKGVSSFRVWLQNWLATFKSVIKFHNSPSYIYARGNNESLRKLVEKVEWALLFIICALLGLFFFLPGEKIPPDDIEITNLHPCRLIDNQWVQVNSFTVLQNPAFCGDLYTQFPPQTLTFRAGGYAERFTIGRGQFHIVMSERLKSGQYTLFIEKGRPKAHVEFFVTLYP